jgi:hypothetical protein
MIHLERGDLMPAGAGPPAELDDPRIAAEPTRSPRFSATITMVSCSEVASVYRGVIVVTVRHQHDVDLRRRLAGRLVDDSLHDEQPLCQHRIGDIVTPSISMARSRGR